MINVTKTFLPPQSEYQSILKRAWEKNWITNRGELVLELEAKIKAYLGIKHIIAMTNGTLPIQIAIKALGLKGEIITTPFSYVATTSSIVWEDCTPVFVDIDPEYLTIDETKIEAAITEHTTGILATHVYGNPCNIEVIEKIAQSHRLKVIYDAAHCFGVKYKGQSIFNYGDISTCSFHATKVFHTGEGGAAFCSDKTLATTMFSMHNFGHNGPESFDGVGINAKMSELQAAMGLVNLKYIDSIIEYRKQVCNLYKSYLEGYCRFQNIRLGAEKNYSYFPIIIEEENVNKVMTALELIGVNARRYFRPSLDFLPFVAMNESLTISHTISNSILCLPLYYGLENEDIERISSTIIKVLK